MRGVRAGTALLIACILHVIGCAPARDLEAPHASVPVDAAPRAPSHVDAPPAGSPRADYQRVLRRARVLLALAEARGVNEARLSSALEALADRVEQCTARAQREGWLVPTAMRVVFELDDHGQVEAIEPQLEEPERGGKLALLCVVAPIRALNYGVSERPGRRGMALELQLSDAPAAR